MYLSEISQKGLDLTIFFSHRRKFCSESVMDQFIFLVLVSFLEERVAEVSGSRRITACSAPDEVAADLMLQYILLWLIPIVTFNLTALPSIGLEPLIEKNGLSSTITYSQ